MQVTQGSPIFLFAGAALRKRLGAVELEERWVNPAAAPEYALQDFTKIRRINISCAWHAPFQRVEYRIEAAFSRDETGVRSGDEDVEPCLMLHRRTWTPNARRVGGRSLASRQPISLHRAISEACRTQAKVFQGGPMNELKISILAPTLALTLHFDPRFDPTRTVRAPRGTELTCKSWLTEAACGCCRTTWIPRSPRTRERTGGLRRHRPRGARLGVLRRIARER